MAKYTAEISGEIFAAVTEIETLLTQKSATFSVEEESFQTFGENKMIAKAYERYSYFGGNRVGMTVIFVETNQKISITAFSVGGSRAMIFKINTWGENEFLSTLAEAVNDYNAFRREWK